MSTPTVYVFCDANCRHEGMTKEQILTAITQAVENGVIGDVDTGFVTTLKTVNGTYLKFYYGTKADFDALPADQKENVFAIFSNDTIGEDMKSSIEELQETVKGILDGTLSVGLVRVTTATELEKGWTEGTSIPEDGVYQIKVTTVTEGALDNDTHHHHLFDLICYKYRSGFGVITHNACSDAVFHYVSTIQQYERYFVECNNGTLKLRKINSDGTTITDITEESTIYFRKIANV